MLGDHGLQKPGDDLLLGAWQLGDGIELLLEARDRPAPGATLHGGGGGGTIIFADQRLDGHAQQLGEPGEHGDGHAPLANLVGGEPKAPKTHLMEKNGSVVLCMQVAADNALSAAVPPAGA